MKLARLLVSICAALPVAAAAQQPAASAAPPVANAHVMTNLSEVKWADGPPFLPKGGKFFVLAGDPSQPGPFTILSKLPASYTIPPHWHPSDENVTVLSGTFAMGMGEAFDRKSLKTLSAGGYARMPKEMRHYAYSKGGAVLQVQGVGPFSITYVNPADDPRAAAPAAAAPAPPAKK